MKKRSFKNAKLTLKKQKISNLESGKVNGGSHICPRIIAKTLEISEAIISAVACPEPLTENNGCLDSQNDHSCQCNVA